MLASVCRTSGLVQSGQAKAGAALSFCFSSSKDFWCSGVHFHLAFFFRSLCSGAEMRAAFFMKRRYHEMRPRNQRASLRFSGGARFRMALTLSGSVCSPFSLTMCPRYLSLNLKNWHFSGFGLSLASYNF